MKTLIATATKHNKIDFKNTRLSKSLKSHKKSQSIVSYELQPTYENTYGLCNVYNRYLTKENINKYDCILFVHDDIHIDSINFLTCIRDQFKLGYDVVGLAGGSKLQIKKPCLWHLMCKQDTYSGVVGHYKNKNEYYQTIFGPTPKEVILLDGLFMAVKTKSIALNNIQFDENIKGFHHYDLKFCLDCHLAGMRLTTAPIQVIHDSPGLTEFTEEFAKSEDYLYNVLVKHANKRK
tara:strand:- start:158 stop:862 length:705 start_codon:yes stop_codon:yes gene_type:complete